MGPLLIAAADLVTQDKEKVEVLNAFFTFTFMMMLNLKKGREGVPRELQDSQPHLSPWESDGTTNSGKHFQAHKIKEGDWGYLAWIHQGEVIFSQHDNLW